MNLSPSTVHSLKKTKHADVADLADVDRAPAMALPGATISANPADNSSSRPTGSLWVNVYIPLIILAAGAGVVLALGTVAPKSREADDDSMAGRLRRLPPANVMRVLSMKEIGKPLELRVDGLVVPYREIAIAAEVSGRIIKKSSKCETGSYVNKGEFLVEIDATDYEQDVDRLTRMREQDYEALKEVDQEIVNVKRLVTLASDDVKLQEREVKRFESMPGGFASEGELDRARKALLSAVQSEVGFENQLSLLAARRSKLEAAERLATTQLKSAQTNLERTKIYSPVDGIIVEENAELNSFIQRGSAIATLDDVTKAEVLVNLRMDQLHWVLDQRRDTEISPIDSDNLADGDVALFGAEAAGDSGATPGYSLPATPAIIQYEINGRTDAAMTWAGTLVRYNGIGLDTRSRTVPVVVIVDQPQNYVSGTGEKRDASVPSPLVRGMYVTVRLQIQPKTSLVAIPSVAIQPGNRIWQFLPDDSVLADQEKSESALASAGALVPDTNPATLVSKTEEKPVAEKPNAIPGEKVDAFDAGQWQAGRVKVRNKVVAVDSLWVSGDEGDTPDQAQNRSASGTKGGRRYWVCEIGGDDVKGGDWVVSSPLGDFDQEIAARVKNDELK